MNVRSARLRPKHGPAMRRGASWKGVHGQLFGFRTATGRHDENGGARRSDARTRFSGRTRRQQRSGRARIRSEEQKSEPQSLMHKPYSVLSLKKQRTNTNNVVKQIY